MCTLYVHLTRDLIIHCNYQVLALFQLRLLMHLNEKQMTYIFPNSHHKTGQCNDKLHIRKEIPFQTTDPNSNFEACIAGVVGEQI